MLSPPDPRYYAMVDTYAVARASQAYRRETSREDERAWFLFILLALGALAAIGLWFLNR